MSLRLPSRPSLGHLKKQAKDVLRLSRRQNPQRRLADAQHALARGYGFSNWVELKLHVESATPRRGRPEPVASRPREGAAARQRNPLAGIWATRLTEVADGPSHGVVSKAAVEIDVTHDVVTLTQVAVDPAGRDVAMKMTMHVDGHDHPAQFGNDLMLRARWADDRTLETIVTHRETVVSAGTYEVSTDGQRLVVSSKDQRIELERIWPR